MEWNKKEILSEKFKTGGFEHFKKVYENLVELKQAKKLSDKGLEQLFEDKTGLKVLTNKIKENGTV